MNDYSYGYEYRGEHRGLGLSTAEQPDAFAVREHRDDVVCGETRYVPERTCRKVPGKMHYGQRRPKCSECGYGLGDDRWGWCPKCGAKIEEVG